MKYEVSYTNPNNIICTGELVEVFNGIAQARAFVKRGRQYPGSFQLICVEKVAADGTRTWVMV